jgi:hypothetical protein
VGTRAGGGIHGAGAAVSPRSIRAVSASACLAVTACEGGGARRAAARNAHTAHTGYRDFGGNLTDSHGHALAQGSGVIWFYEKQDDLLVCEIRRAEDDQSAFEFEIADSKGPTTHRFGSAKELIAKYLEEQARLMREGWRPNAGNLAILE